MRKRLYVSHILTLFVGAGLVLTGRVLCHKASDCYYSLVQHYQENRILHDDTLFKAAQWEMTSGHARAADKDLDKIYDRSHFTNFYTFRLTIDKFLQQHP